jgi:hypothetical protein
MFNSPSKGLTHNEPTEENDEVGHHLMPNSVSGLG